MQNDIKARLEQARAEAVKKMQERIENAKMKAELALLTNKKFQNAMVSQAIREQTTKKLNELNLICSKIVSDNPVYSRTLGQDRKWSPSKSYGFGNQFAELSGLLTGIQYSVSEHNELLLAATGLSPDLIERTLEALGSLPYYSTSYNEIVDGIRTNVVELLECITLVEQALSIQIDKARITQQVADSRYHTAMVKAERTAAEAANANEIANFVIR